MVTYFCTNRSPIEIIIAKKVYINHKLLKLLRINDLDFVQKLGSNKIFRKHSAKQVDFLKFFKMKI